MSNIETIVWLAIESASKTGDFNASAIALKTGVNRKRVLDILRAADRDGGIGRTCTTTLSNGRRCGAPLPREAWGRFKSTCCALHTSLDVAIATRPSELSIADAGTGEAAIVVRKPANQQAELFAAKVEAPPMPEHLATALDGLTVETIDGTPRASAFQLAELLGFGRPRKIKDLIERHKDELDVLGRIYSRPTVGRQSTGNGASREYTVDVPWLNRTQCLIVAMKADTANAAEARVKIAKSFEREQDRAVSPPVTDNSGLATVVAELVKGQQQLTQALAGLVATMATIASGAVAQAPALPVVSGYDRDAAKATKGDYMSGSDIAAFYGLPQGKWKGRSTSLVTLFLQLSGVHQQREFAREIPIAVSTVNGDAERSQWVYQPDAVAKSDAMHDVAASIRSHIGNDESTIAAFNSARIAIKTAYSAAA